VPGPDERFSRSDGSAARECFGDGVVAPIRSSGAERMIPFLKEHSCAISRDGGCPVANSIVRCKAVEEAKAITGSVRGFRAKEVLCPPEPNCPWCRRDSRMLLWTPRWLTSLSSLTKVREWPMRWLSRSVASTAW
jgi:hypothetical protein